MSQTHDYTPQLHQLMSQVHLTSLASLYRSTDLPANQIQRLRQGQIQTLPVTSLIKLSQVLNISILQLLEQFMPSELYSDLQQQRDARSSPTQQEFLSLKREYQRLQEQLEQQQQTLAQTFQQAVLQTLEPLILQWPTAAYAAQNNPQAPAVKILPLLRPLDQLLQSWDIKSIGSVGEETIYNPQWHQPLDGLITAETPVRVRYVGYRRGEQLLYRAKVSAIP